MVGGTARLAAGAAAAVALIVVSYAIALGGGVGGVGSGTAAVLVETHAWIGERLQGLCGCDLVEAVVAGLAGLGEGASRLAETTGGAAVAYAVAIAEAIHGAAPTGLAESAPAVAGIAAGALLIAFWRIVTAKADPPATETVDGTNATGSRTGGPGPAGLPGSFRHVAPSADALIHEADAVDFTGEKSLVEVIAFMIVAEFGVLSSVTISAPNPQIGLGFFVLFLVGSTIFVRQPYRSYARALYHLAVGVVVAIAVSILLGHFWGQIPLDLLLSQRYFATASMVAAVTGIAFSLLIGGR